MVRGRQARTRVDGAPTTSAEAQVGGAASGTDFETLGYAVVRGVFRSDDIAELSGACDRFYAEGVRAGTPFCRGPTLFQVTPDARLGSIVRYVRWPSYLDETLDRYRLDLRLFEIVRPLIGDDLKQIVNQIHWKPPGAAMTDFGLHQDIRFRRPREAYREPLRSYVQTAIAIDPHGPRNGGLVVYPGSHRQGELALGGETRVMDTPFAATDLERIGLDPGRLVHLELDPGDVALWNLFTVHGSGRNRSKRDRRIYINGFVTAESCDVGLWAFRGGVPVPLSEADPEGRASVLV